MKITDERNYKNNNFCCRRRAPLPDRREMRKDCAADLIDWADKIALLVLLYFQTKCAILGKAKCLCPERGKRIYNWIYAARSQVVTKVRTVYCFYVNCMFCFVSQSVKFYLRLVGRISYNALRLQLGRTWNLVLPKMVLTKLNDYWTFAKWKHSAERPWTLQMLLCLHAWAVGAVSCCQISLFLYYLLFLCSFLRICCHKST